VEFSHVGRVNRSVGAGFFGGIESASEGAWPIQTDRVCFFFFFVVLDTWRTMHYVWHSEETPYALVYSVCQLAQDTVDCPGTGVGRVIHLD